MAQQNLSDADTGPVAKSKIQGNFDELYAAVDVAVVTVSASRDVTASDTGKMLKATTALTLTIPAGLSPAPSFIGMPPSSGDLTISVSGGATVNGGATSLTRALSVNPAGVAVINSSGDAYGVSGA